MVETNEMEVIQAVINPLAFLEAEESKRNPALSISDHAVTRYLCELKDTAPADFVRRYLELTHQAPRIFVVPSEKEIIEKMTVPLHGAIACYTLGNYFGTIALCGLVSEMLAIFIFEIYEVGLRDPAMTIEKFERESQKTRVRFLYDHRILGDAQKTKFDAIREIRRRHLHFLSHDIDARIADAARCFQNTIDLFELVFRNKFGDGADAGKVMLRPEVIRYLRRKSAVRDDAQS